MKSEKKIKIRKILLEGYLEIDEERKDYSDYAEDLIWIKALKWVLED